jgi:hypothetical protein
MHDFKFISYDDQGDILRLAINRPPYNVLDIATMEEMNTALDMAMENTTAKVLLITGNGDKTFSSGVDVVDHTPGQGGEDDRRVPRDIEAPDDGADPDRGCGEWRRTGRRLRAGDRLRHGGGLGERQAGPARNQARRFPADRRDPPAAPDPDDQGDGTAARAAASSMRRKGTASAWSMPCSRRRASPPTARSFSSNSRRFRAWP